MIGMYNKKEAVRKPNLRFRTAFFECSPADDAFSLFAAQRKKQVLGRQASKNQNRPGVRAALIRIEGGNDKEESLLINRSAGGVTRFPFDGFSINRKCVKNALSM